MTSAVVECGYCVISNVDPFICQERVMIPDIMINALLLSIMYVLAD